MALLAVLLALTALIVVYLWQSWQQIDLTRRIEETKDKLVPIRERNKRLRVQVIRTFSLERIERIARNRLDMILPTPKQQEAE